MRISHFITGGAQCHPLAENPKNRQPFDQKKCLYTAEY